VTDEREQVTRGYLESAAPPDEPEREEVEREGAAGRLVVINGEHVFIDLQPLEDEASENG
jgi:hypothetical protein